MRSWHGVVTKIAKQGKGAVVKNRLGPEELLVPFTVSTLVEVDLDARIYGTDVDDTPWAEGDERKEVLVGTEVELLTDTDTFPTHASQVLSANFRFALDIVKGGLSGPVRKGAVLVIYHDFQQEIRRGDSGSAFAEAVVAYARNKLYKPAFAIKADTNYAQLVRDLGKVAAESGEQYFIDTILIATHGTAGQLWLGNPHGDSTADVMARRVRASSSSSPRPLVRPFSNCSARNWPSPSTGATSPGTRTEKRRPSSCASPPTRERSTPARARCISMPAKRVVPR
ncbi:hypothetical protein [Pseudomonas aeruginosa]|uniref:hypothetical protein n=1 Tax=Pseudomonas aeruginosa TaxID=287 RepID=UPI001ABBE537|nr:hypothetical protein [Pseudomonas aeruginosa]